jgi:hypothetical protein
MRENLQEEMRRLSHVINHFGGMYLDDDRWLLEGG